MQKKKVTLSTRQKWMQRFFAVAGNIAPDTTIRILVRLIFTPKKRPFKPAQVQCLEEAEKFDFEVADFENANKKLQLACYSWGKGPKTILLIHGWDARAVDFYKMIPHLVNAGYKVMAFDGPAHGNSEGERSHLIDFKRVTRELILKLGKPYAIIGHSMGGAAAAFMLLDYEIRIEKLITIAIPIMSKRFFEEVFSIMKIPSKMRQAFFRGYELELGESIEKYNLIARKEPIKANNILMVYDEHDEVISGKDVKEFLAGRPEITVLNVKDAGHYSIVKDKRTINGILEFLAK